MAKDTVDQVLAKLKALNTTDVEYLDAEISKRAARFVRGVQRIRAAAGAG